MLKERNKNNQEVFWSPEIKTLTEGGMIMKDISWTHSQDSNFIEITCVEPEALKLWILRKITRECLFILH